MRIAVPLVALPMLLSVFCATAAAGSGTPLRNPFDPTPHAPNAIDAHYDFQLVPSLETFELRGRFDVREVELNKQGISAQAIRDGTPVARSEFERHFRDAVAKELASAFMDAPPASTQLRFDYGQSDLDGNPYEPPIKVSMNTQIPLTPAALGMPSMKFTSGAELAKAFLYGGGSAVIDRKITVPPGLNVQFQVIVPEFLRLSNRNHEDVTALSFPADNSNGATASRKPIQFNIALVENALSQNVRDGPTVRATFVSHDNTTPLVKALPWSQGTYSADLDLWIEVPSMSTAYFGYSPLPSNLQTDRYSADLLRIAVRERFVTAEDVHQFFAVLIEEGLQEGFGESVSVEMDRDAFRQSVARPIGGKDGKSVEPLLIHAKAHLPLRGDKMMLGSSLAQTLGTITGIPATFPVSNDGAWVLDLTLFYPEGVTLDVQDSEGFAEKVYAGQREGVHVLLHPGQHTNVKVHGRPDFDPLVVMIGLLEVALLTVGIAWSVRRTRQVLAERRRLTPRN